MESEIEQMRQLQVHVPERLIVARGRPHLSVYDEEVTQWMMDEPVADIRGDRLSGGVVLNERLKKHLGRKCDRGAHPYQIRRETAIREIYDVTSPISPGLETSAEVQPYAAIHTPDHSPNLNLGRQLLLGSTYVFDIAAIDAKGRVSPVMRSQEFQLR